MCLSIQGSMVNIVILMVIVLRVCYEYFLKYYSFFTSVYIDYNIIDGGACINNKCSCKSYLTSDIHEKSCLIQTLNSPCLNGTHNKCSAFVKNMVCNENYICKCEDEYPYDSQLKLCKSQLCKIFFATFLIC